jgi:hypothetical protein
MLNKKSGKALKKALNGGEPNGPMTEQQSKSRSAETPRVQDEPIKMKTKKELVKSEEATGSIYSRKGKKPGESYYENILSTGRRYSKGPYEEDVMLPYKRTIKESGGATIEPYRMKKRG